MRLIKNKRLKSYSEKYVKSGRAIETFEYEKPVFRGYAVRTVGEKRKIGTKRNDNIARAKAKLRRLILANVKYPEKPLFLTFTWRENETDRSVALKQWARFIREMKQRFPEARYIYVIETQERGAMHVHALFFGDLRMMWVAQSLWKNGIMWPERVKYNDELHIANYMGKYMGKGAASVFNERSFSTSQNLEKPVEILGDEFRAIIQGQQPEFSAVHTTPDGNVVYYKLFILQT